MPMTLRQKNLSFFLSARKQPYTWGRNIIIKEFLQIVTVWPSTGAILEIALRMGVIPLTLHLDTFC